MTAHSARHLMTRISAKGAIMEGKEIAFLINFINVGMKILSVRVALFVTLIMTFSLFMLVMWQPDYWRLGGAIAFALLVFLPVIRQDSKGNITQGEQK